MRRKRLKASVCVGVLFGAACTVSTPARAQAAGAAPPAPPQVDPLAPPAPAVPPPAPDAVSAPPPSPSTTKQLKESVAPEPPNVAPITLAAPPPKPIFNMNMGFGVRAGLRLQDPDQPKRMSEVHLGNSYDATVEARFNGRVNEQFSWVADLNAVLNAPTRAVAGTVGVMDLIAQYKAADEFQIWAGRLLVPSDRSNFTGPFFMIPWNYPGFFFQHTAPLGPKDGPNGRDQGVTIWGNALDAKLKYYGGFYGIDQDAQPYFSGRVSYSLQGSEPGYFGSSTYYGSKSVFTLGAGAQYQKDGSTDRNTRGGTKDTALVMLDALAEEVVPGVGTFTMEGQFYKYNDGYVFGSATGPMGTVPLFAPSSSFYALFSYLTPERIGPGELQPMIRLQQAIDPAWTIVDAAVAYVIKDYSARIVLNYQHIDRGTTYSQQTNQEDNALQLGIQLQTL